VDEENNILKQRAALLLGYKYDFIIKTREEVKIARSFTYE